MRRAAAERYRYECAVRERTRHVYKKRRLFPIQYLRGGMFVPVDLDHPPPPPVRERRLLCGIRRGLEYEVLGLDAWGWEPPCARWPQLWRRR